MVRSKKDPFWIYVEQVMTDEGKPVLMCTFCKRTFSEGTAITRIKWHLSGERNHGVAICTDTVPKEVKESAKESASLAMPFGNKRQKTRASSSNVNDNAISSCPQVENNEVNNSARDAGGIQKAAVQDTEHGVGEGRTSSHAAAGDLMENMSADMMQIDRSITWEGIRVDAHETRGEASQATGLVEMHQGVGGQLWPDFGEVVDEFFAGENEGNRVSEGLLDAFESGQRIEQVGEVFDHIENVTGGLLQPVAAASSSGGLTQPVVGDSSSGGLQQPVVGTSSSGWLTHNICFMPNAPESSQRIETNEEDFLPRLSMDDAPESGQRTEQGDQLLEQSTWMVPGVDNWAGDGGRKQMEVQGMEQRVGDAHETRGEASQAPDMENVTGGLVQPVVGASSCGGLLQPVVGTTSGGLTHNIRVTRGDPLPTSSTKIVGQEFNKNVIWSWLMDDEVSSIAIYGMGGVGKTTLVAQIHNQLLKTSDPFFHVYWISVSQENPQEISIKRLQNSIAKLIGLDLSNEQAELCRAGKCLKELTNGQKWVLILDNLWDSFDPDQVGIPVQVKGCKLILTTRSEKVCHEMKIQKKIKVKPLSGEEAWNLFTDKFGNDIMLSSEKKDIARFIADECDGLPLGIITIATTMRGVADVRQWRNDLRELKESKGRQKDMEPKVFRRLRYSYTHLKDSSLQQCFLYCSLFPKAFVIDRNDLIGYLIDEGVIEGMRSRRDEFDKGHAMLSELLDVGLLERGRNSGDEYVRMHNLNRYMALQMQQKNSKVMIQAGAELKELPDAEKWTENLEKVSLMVNEIEEIPSSHSPKCHKLSTLLLCHNKQLQSMPYSFFKELPELKILDLSHTSIRTLPNSVSELTNLNALLLQNCLQLTEVPSLQNLTKLKRLDLGRSTELESVPQGLERLSNLRYLRLNGCGEKEFPSGILPNLCKLQVLVLENNMARGYAPVTVKGKEVACLRKLETLECYFEGHSDYMDYLKFRDETQSLSSYQICVGQLEKFCRNKSVALCNFSINRDRVMFPKDIEELVINECNDARSLCDVSSLIKYATELQVIRIWYCNSMESLVSSSWLCSAPLPLPSFNDIFSRLKQFHCYRCTSMKKLFPLFSVSSLIHLEVIRVAHCEKMEEIIATGDEEGVTGEESSSCDSNIVFNLPNLRILELKYLPALKSICSAKLICNSLEEIGVRNCEKLKRMSVSIPLLDNRQPSLLSSLRIICIDERKWWDSVDWEHKDVLSPFVKIW